MTKKAEGLTYVGDGRFLPGIPATDLSEDDIKALGVKANDLLASGLYEEAKPAKPATPAKSED